MDRVKIGEFISTCRKDKHLSQEQLAEMLNITSKSVSKWENGKCLPDYSDAECSLAYDFYIKLFEVNESVR